MSRREITDWIIAVLIGFLVVIACKTFVATNYQVIGKSMMPTLSHNDRVIVSKISEIERMDIVIFHSEEDDYVKRVIGLPGDTIQYEQDRLYINGKQLDEPFLEKNPMYQNPSERFTEDFTLDELTGSKRVPKDKIFVLGDNRLSSLDSRHFHFINKEEIIGEVKAKYWPLSEVRLDFSSE